MMSIKSSIDEGGSFVSSYGTYSNRFGERDIEDVLYIIISANSPCTVIRPLFHYLAVFLGLMFNSPKIQIH